MTKIEKYLNSITQYYTSANRPYNEVGRSFLSLENLRPESVLKPKLKTVVYGAPGSGKTTFLDSVSEYAAKSRIWIPIFVSLRNYSSKLSDLIEVSITKFENEVSFKHLIDNISTNQKIVFLFDGLDEVSSPFQNKLQNEIYELSHSSIGECIIITSRTQIKVYDWKDFQIISIPVLNQNQIADFLKRETGSDELLNILTQNPDLLELASKPAFLHTIRNAWAHKTDFREYLMREIPLYTAWRGHSKLLGKSLIEPEVTDKILMSTALDIAIRDLRNFPLFRLKEKVSLFSSEDFDTILKGVLATDIIIEIDNKTISFSHKSLLEAYAARELVRIFRSTTQIDILMQSVLKSQYASQIAQYFLSVLNQNELKTLTSTLSPVLVSTMSEYGREIIAERVSEIDNVPENQSEQLKNATKVANNFLKNQTKTRRDILIIAVHGFNTRGEWKNRLGLVLTRATDGERFLYSPWDYGEFKIGILFPWARSRQIKKFQTYYNNLMSQFPEKPEVCVVAHSFGTYIIGHSIRRFPEIKFDRVLFLGSALPKKFSWKSIKNRIGKLLNLIAMSDTALSLTPFVSGLGSAGKNGFKDTPEWLVQLRENYSDHSDLFGDEYMRIVWLPFFRDGSTPTQS